MIKFWPVIYLDSFDNKNDINFDTSLPSSKPLELHDFLYLFINLEDYL